jgi:hypothetical protein
MHAQTRPWSYHFYISQGENLKARLREHESPFYRSRNPSLHYRVWDSFPVNESTFVILSQCTEMDPIALNLLEVWGASIFQTLSKNDLVKHLPDDTVLLLQAGSHLNIAHPLWQRISKKKQDIYGSADPSRREILGKEDLALLEFEDYEPNKEEELYEWQRTTGFRWKTNEWEPEARAECHMGAARL